MSRSTPTPSSPTSRPSGTHPLVGLAVRPFFPETDAITKIDDLTVEFHLLDANAYFPATVGRPARHAGLAEVARRRRSPTRPSTKQPVGTGPFKFDSRSQDSVTRFVRNDEWWGGEVYLDAVEFYPVPDTATRVDLMLGGELEALQTTDPDSIMALRDEGVPNVYDDSAAEQFAMINTAAAPFDDIRARQALAYATPRQTYLDLIALGVIRGADQRFIPEDPYHNPDVKQVGDDPDARPMALAAEYCAERGAETNPTTGEPDLHRRQDQHRAPVRRVRRSSRPVAPRSSTTAGARPSTSPSTSCSRTSTSSRPRSGSTTSTSGASSRPRIRRPTTCGCCAARSAGSRSTGRGSATRSATRCCCRPRPPPTRPSGSTLYQQVEQMINDAYTYIFLHPHGLDERLHRQRPRRVRSHVARGRRRSSAPSQVARGSAGLDRLTDTRRPHSPHEIEMNYWLQRIGHRDPRCCSPSAR